MSKAGAVLLACGIAALLPVAPAMAEDATVGKHAGELMFRVRGIGVLPATSSSVSAIGGQVQASDTIDPEIDLSYFFTDNIAVEGIGAVTRHHITATGTSLGNVDVGQVSLLPPTVTLQYHPLPASRFSPYVGAGINYTFFFDSSPAGGTVTRAHYANNFGAALQVGFDYQISGNWFANVDLKQLFLNTTATLNGGSVVADVNLNPTIIGVGIGYLF